MSNKKASEKKKKKLEDYFKSNRDEIFSSKDKEAGI